MHTTNPTFFALKQSRNNRTTQSIHCLHSFFFSSQIMNMLSECVVCILPIVTHTYLRFQRIIAVGAASYYLVFVHFLLRDQDSSFSVKEWDIWQRCNKSWDKKVKFAQWLADWLLLMAMNVCVWLIAAKRESFADWLMMMNDERAWIHVVVMLMTNTWNMYFKDKRCGRYIFNI